MATDAGKIIVCAIAAMDEARVIGINNSLPWKIPEDMRRFSSLTRGHTVLMGRKTYDSLPAKFKPLPDRKNVIATRSANISVPADVLLVNSAETFVQECKECRLAIQGERLWVIGGEKIYEATLPFWDEVYLTAVKGRHKGDAFLPPFESNFKVAEKEDRAEYSFITYLRSD